MRLMVEQNLNKPPSAVGKIKEINHMKASAQFLEL